MRDKLGGPRCRLHSQEGGVATHGIREWLILSYQTFVTCLIYLIYSPFVRFVKFCHLINLSSSYQTSVIFSRLVFYSLFTLSSHPIKAPTVHITNITRSLVLSCACSRHDLIFLTHQASLAIVPFWLWGIGPWLGVSSQNKHICFRGYWHIAFVNKVLLWGEADVDVMISKQLSLYFNLCSVNNNTIIKF